MRTRQAGGTRIEGCARLFIRSVREKDGSGGAHGIISVGEGKDVSLLFSFSFSFFFQFGMGGVLLRTPYSDFHVLLGFVGVGDDDVGPEVQGSAWASLGVLRMC